MYDLQFVSEEKLSNFNEDAWQTIIFVFFQKFTEDSDHSIWTNSSIDNLIVRRNQLNLSVPTARNLTHLHQPPSKPFISGWQTGGGDWKVTRAIRQGALRWFEIISVLLGKFFPISSFVLFKSCSFCYYINKFGYKIPVIVIGLCSPCELIPIIARGCLIMANEQ